jgi:hypothetical protein
MRMGGAMTRSEKLLAWCWTASALGYIAVSMSILRLNGAVGVALAAALGIYLGHRFVKQPSSHRVGAKLNTVASRKFFNQCVVGASRVLAMYSIAAIAYYALRWEDRAFEPSLNALLIAPLAYYGFACGKRVLRSSKFTKSME